MVLWISSLQAINKSPVLIQAMCRHHHISRQASHVHVISCITQYRPGFSGVMLFDSGSACGGEWYDECVSVFQISPSSGAVCSLACGAFTTCACSSCMLSVYVYAASCVF